MSVVDLASSSGVVTIDLNANPSDFYRLDTTETVSSWVVNNAVDGDGFLLAIALNTGHTVSFTGLVDTWTNGVPTLVVGETIYFPLVYDGTTWVGESSNTAATDPALVLQTIAHTTSSALAVNCDNGHTVEATLTNNVTGHTITNFNNGEKLSIFYIASGANRTVDFSGATEFPTYANPGVVTVTSASVIRAVFCRVGGVTYLMEVTEGPTALDPSQVIDTVAHSSPGALTIDADDGHTVEVTLTNDVTGHTINNLLADDVLTVHYLASGAARSVDFTSATTADELTNPGEVVLAQDEVYRAVWITLFSTTYLVSAALVA